LAFLVRPYLREYFPCYDIYLWIDSDVWLQSPDMLRALIEGAARKGMAIAGLVCGVLGLLIGIAVVVLFLTAARHGHF